MWTSGSDTLRGAFSTQNQFTPSAPFFSACDAHSRRSEGVGLRPQ